jgi:[histone H3]-lysine9 N-trimethyltransferase SUV39H
VVQHGRTVAISISKTKDKGWGKRNVSVAWVFLSSFNILKGVFAGPRKIYNGTFIGIYAGELLTDEVGEERGK